MIDALDKEYMVALHKQLLADIGKVVNAEIPDMGRLFRNLTTESEDIIIETMAYDPQTDLEAYRQIKDMWGTLVSIMNMEFKGRRAFSYVDNYEKIIVHMDAASYFVRAFPEELKALSSLVEYTNTEEAIKEMSVQESSEFVLNTLRKKRLLPLGEEFIPYQILVKKYGKFKDKVWLAISTFFFSIYDK